jgi:hypothetical protein
MLIILVEIEKKKQEIKENDRIYEILEEFNWKIETSDENENEKEKRWILLLYPKRTIALLEAQKDFLAQEKARLYEEMLENQQKFLASIS